MDIKSCSRSELYDKVDELVKLKKYSQLKYLLDDVNDALFTITQCFCPETLCNDEAERIQKEIVKFQSFKQIITSELEKIEQSNTEQTQPIKNAIENNIDDNSKSKITFSNKLLELLQRECFIEDATKKPVKWIAEHKKSKGYYNNFVALLDLLCLLDYSDEVIKDRKQINTYFNFLSDAKIKVQNYTSITDSKRKLKRPIISEHHAILRQIVEESRNV